MSIYAIVPAAGRSRRMGDQHKLLLEWKGRTLIDHVLDAWTSSVVDQVIVVVRHDDVQLQRACRRWPSVDLVIPERDPEDMKRSIQLGLEHIAETLGPTVSDRWMVAPADVPTLTPDLIDRVAAAVSTNVDADRIIVVPRFAGRRGHPVSFPWSLISEVMALADDQGVNALITAHGAKWLDLPGDQRPVDIDTPLDYRSLTKDEDC